YDIVCTIPYQPRDVLALGFMGTKAWPAREAVEQFGGQHCAVAKAAHVIDEVIEAVHAFRPAEQTPVWKSLHGVISAGADSLRPSTHVSTFRARRKSALAASKRNTPG